MSSQVMDKATKLRVAAVFCWVLGVLNLLCAVALGISRWANHEPVGYAVLMLVAGLGLCFSAYSLQRKNDYAPIVAVGFAFLSIFCPPVVGVVLGAAIIFFIALTWHESS